MSTNSLTNSPLNNGTSLQNKVALITGGNSGIGKAAAIALSQAGAAVVIGARRETEGKAVVDEIVAAGGRALFLQTDVTKPEQMIALVALAESEFGGLDIAFNNAGTEGAGFATIDQESEENLRHVMEVNFFGLWNSMKAIVPALTRRGGGTIINTSSVAGLRGFGAFSTYASSKFAVEGLTRSAAHELAPLGIRVNSVAPGPIETDLLNRTTGGDHSGFTQLVPQARTGSPEEVASLVRFLASEESSYMTGHALRVDGGMVA